jgi:magnesium-transporting ATPase (P-type)
LFFGALEDFMLRLLLVCACISISIDLGFAEAHERSHAWIEGFAIFVAVFVVASVGSWNDYKKEE